MSAAERITKQIDSCDLKVRAHAVGATLVLDADVYSRAQIYLTDSLTKSDIKKSSLSPDGVMQMYVARTTHRVCFVHIALT